MLREFKEGTGDRTRPRSPQEASRRGPGSRAAPIPFQGRTRRYDAAAIWHSVGGKVAYDPSLWKCCNPDTRLVHSKAFVISSACDWRGRSFRGGLTGNTAKCCQTDTPPASLSNVSRSRPTTDQHRCFVAAWLMLNLRKRSAHVGPGALPHTPLRAPGPAATSTNSPVPC